MAPTNSSGAGSYSRRTSSSHLSSAGQYQRSSSYSQGGRPPLSPSSTSPARRLSYESTSQLPRHTGLGGGISTPPDGASSESTESSPQLLPIDHDNPTAPLPRSMGAGEPFSTASSSNPNSPPASRSNSSHSSSNNHPTSRSPSQPFPSSRPHAISTSTSHSSNTLLGPSYPNQPGSRPSRHSIASSTTSSRSYGPTASSLGPGIALRSGVPHGGRGIKLQMPAPLGPQALPSLGNLWVNGLNEQEPRRWDVGAGRERERERSRSSSSGGGMERRREQSATARSSKTPVEEEEGEFEDEEDSLEREEGSTSSGEREQERRRRP